MRRIFFILAVLTLIINHGADACVGRIINIGAIDSASGQLMAEMLSVLIGERTGTTVSIKYFKNSDDLYDAVKKKEVGLLLEDTNHAMEVLNRPKEEDVRKAYAIAKEEYRKNLNLIWLEPFCLLNGNRNHFCYAPLITVEVSGNFPALPRVINKLAGIINEETAAKFSKSLDMGEKPRKIARDFLKAKKLI